MTKKIGDVLEGYTVRYKMQCGKVYVTYNFHEDGLVEIFVRLGKAGSCPGCLVQGIARIISISLQNDTPIGEISKTLVGMKCVGAQPGLVDDRKRLTSCMDAIAKEMISISKGEKNV